MFDKYEPDVSGRTLKGVCMVKSAQNLDMNRVLSMCEFIGVAAFANIYVVRLTEISIFTCICLNLEKLFAKMQYFQSMLKAELNTLKESCTFKGNCAVNAEIFICNFLTGPLIKRELSNKV